LKTLVSRAEERGFGRADRGGREAISALAKVPLMAESRTVEVACEEGRGERRKGFGTPPLSRAGERGFGKADRGGIEAISALARVFLVTESRTVKVAREEGRGERRKGFGTPPVSRAEERDLGRADRDGREAISALAKVFLTGAESGTLEVAWRKEEEKEGRDFGAPPNFY